MMPIIVKRSLLFLMIALVSSSSLRAWQLSEREQTAASQHFKRGMESLVSEKYDVAETEFKAAVAIDPTV
jgi:Tfp pilus assembly protein PilF